MLEPAMGDCGRGTAAGAFTYDLRLDGRLQKAGEQGRAGRFCCDDHEFPDVYVVALNGDRFRRRARTSSRNANGNWRKWYRLDSLYSRPHGPGMGRPVQRTGSQDEAE